VKSQSEFEEVVKMKDGKHPNPNTDGATYAQKMMELTTSAQNENDDDE